MEEDASVPVVEDDQRVPVQGNEIRQEDPKHLMKMRVKKILTVSIEFFRRHLRTGLVIDLMY